ncbi:MAG: chromate transporter [Candidatus Omnitrophota bacterium]
MIIVQLFLSFFRVGLFAVGGAYSFLPLIEREVVEKYHWLAKDEFIEILGAVRILPGAISIKYASYTGYKIAGIPGMIAANLGNLLGPAVLIILALGLYMKYKDLPSVKNAFNMVHLAVFAMIIAVAFKLVDVRQLIQLKSLLVVVISFILFIYTKVHPALIIIGAGILGAVLK